jgi:hypothetical protein
MEYTWEVPNANAWDRLCAYEEWKDNGVKEEGN